MNAASRILAVYDKAMAYKVGSGVPFLQLWGSVLGVAEKAEPHHEDDITSSLMALRDEINLAKARLAVAGCPTQLYERYFNQVREMASSTRLHQDWKGYRPGYRTTPDSPLSGRPGHYRMRRTSCPPARWAS